MKSMPPRYTLLGVLLSLVVTPTIVRAADVTAKVIDRLGRPVSNAVVDILWLKAVTKGDVRKVGLGKLVSDRDGMVRGTYDEKSVPKGEDIMVEVSKDGYSGYTTTGLQPEFVLERQFGPADVRRIATLQGQAQIDQLRELLAGDFEDSGPGLDGLVFVQEHEFRAELRPWPGIRRSAPRQVSCSLSSGCRMTCGSSWITPRLRRRRLSRTAGPTVLPARSWNQPPKKSGPSCAVAP